MSINNLIKQLSQLGIQLGIDDNDNLRVIADKGAITQEVKQLIVGNKKELLNWLKVKNSELKPTKLPSLIKRQHSNECTLSFAQQRLWLVDQLEKESTAYSIASAMKISGELDAKRLLSSVKEIVERHEILRTNFRQKDGLPYQCINDSSEYNGAFIDIREQYIESVELGEQYLQSQLVKELNQKLDLAEDSLLKVRLYQLSANTHVLFICVHHIASDGWSNQIFLNELLHFYHTDTANVSIEPLPVQYKDFTIWQKECFTESYQNKLLNYWETQLQDWQVLNLHHDKVKNSQLVRTGKQHTILLNNELLQGSKKLAYEQNSTLFTVLLTSFYIFLSKVTNQTDLCIGTDVANRRNKKLEGLIGFFVNQLVLRTKISTRESFIMLLEQVKQMTLDAYSNQDLPFDMLVDKMLGHRDLSQSPFFPVKFIMQNTPQSNQQIDGWEIENLELPFNQAKFEMTWSITELSNGMELLIEYDTSLFEQETIEEYCQHFQHILLTAIESPKKPINLIQLNNQQNVLPNTKQASDIKTIANLVEERAALMPDSLAVVDETLSLTYQQLNSRSNQFAHYLQEWGIESESKVGICMSSGADFIMAICALSKVNAVLIPIDPKVPADRISQIIEESCLELLITHSTLLNILPAYELNFISNFCIDEVYDDYNDLPYENLNLAIHGQQLAYMIFTSGTTGKPKGVMVPVSGLNTLADVHAKTFSVTADSHILQFASIGFDACIWEIVMALGNGATLFCAQREKTMPGIALSQYIEKHDITHITLPPSALSVMPQRKHPSLQVMILAGEQCHDELLQYWHKDVHLFNAYGPSETTVCTTIESYNEELSGFQNSIGLPIAGSYTVIVTPEGGLAATGVAGELCVGGISLGRGYWENPKQTAEKFIPDSFSGETGKRLYRTGDSAKYRRDGSIEFLGRLDNQVKLRGYRVELNEIEQQLLKIGPFKQAVVVLNDDKNAIFAFVVCDNQQLNQAIIKQKLRTILPEYMIPKAIVGMQEIPININGKIDYNALPMDKVYTASTSLEEQTLNAIEEKIHAIWVYLLKLDKIDKNESFFDAGGNSLQLIKMQELISIKFSVELDVADLFKYSSIASLSEFIDCGDKDDTFSKLEQRMNKKNKSARRRSRRKQMDTIQ